VLEDGAKHPPDAALGLARRARCIKQDGGIFRLHIQRRNIPLIGVVRLPGP
jgi:hypothetical protein